VVASLRAHKEAKFLSLALCVSSALSEFGFGPIFLEIIFPSKFLHAEVPNILSQVVRFFLKKLLFEKNIWSHDAYLQVKQVTVTSQTLWLWNCGLREDDLSRGADNVNWHIMN
jgi:hypothetical protein